MSVSIGSVTTSSVAPLRRAYPHAIAIKEVPGANVSYIQSLGDLTDIFACEVLVDDADRATLVGYRGAEVAFSESTYGISGYTVRVQSIAEVQEAPTLWRMTLTLVRKTV